MGAGTWLIPRAASSGRQSLQGLKPASSAALGVPKYLTFARFGFRALQTDLQKMPVVIIP
jgi:hypothetical protein